MPDKPIEHIVKVAKLAEKSGFDYVSVVDGCGFRDVFVTLSAMAAETSSIILGSGGSNPYARNPLLIALATASLDEFSGGRGMLVIVSGGLFTLNPMGIQAPVHPVKAVQETVQVCKRLFNGETITYDGKYVKLRNARIPFDPKPWIPVYVGARSPRLIATAGLVADGVALGNAPPEYMQFALSKLQEGAMKAGRDLRNIRKANFLPTSISRDQRKARELARIHTCYYLPDIPPVALEKAGIPDEDRRKVLEVLPQGVDVASRFVTDRMVDSFTLAGRAEECLEKVKVYKEAGLDEVAFISPFGPDETEAISLIGKEIVAKF